MRPTRYPYSYTENGKVKGILPDYFRKIADYAGLSYEFLVPATRDEYIAYQSGKGTVDISIDARLDTDNYAETKGWGIDRTLYHDAHGKGDAERF